MYRVIPIQKVAPTANVNLSNHTSSDSGQNEMMKFRDVLTKVSEKQTEEKAQRSGSYSCYGEELLMRTASRFDAKG